VRTHACEGGDAVMSQRLDVSAGNGTKIFVSLEGANDVEGWILRGGVQALIPGGIPGRGERGEVAASGI
jgi:hypothetical protein